MIKQFIFSNTTKENIVHDYNLTITSDSSINIGIIKGTNILGDYFYSSVSSGVYSWNITYTSIILGFDGTNISSTFLTIKQGTNSKKIMIEKGVYNNNIDLRPALYNCTLSGYVTKTSDAIPPPLKELPINGANICHQRIPLTGDRIDVNSDRVGYYTWTGKLQEGIHYISCSKPEFKTWSSSFTVTDSLQSHNITCDFSLQSIPEGGGGGDVEGPECVLQCFKPSKPAQLAVRSPGLPTKLIGRCEAGKLFSVRFKYVDGYTTGVACEITNNTGTTVYERFNLPDNGIIYVFTI